MESLFFWGTEPAPRELPELDHRGEPWVVELVTPEGRREVAGRRLPLVETLPMLAAVSAAEVAALPASFASWALGSKLGLELVARERVVPTITRQPGGI